MISCKEMATVGELDLLGPLNICVFMVGFDLTGNYVAESQMRVKAQQKVKTRWMSVHGEYVIVHVLEEV